VYDGSCREVDDITGDILDALSAEGLLDGAVVAVTSDHGEALGEHGQLGHRLSVYDTLLHVPMVVRWKGRLDGGRREDAQVALQDLYPTFLEAARLRTPPGNGVDAVSLASAETRSRTVVAELAWTPLAPETVATRFAGVESRAMEPFGWSFTAVREPGTGPDDRKLIRVVVGDGGPDAIPLRLELYAPALDPREERDLLRRPMGNAERDALLRLRDHLPPAPPPDGPPARR
jgi:arylsulfatase A-like enzyme